MGGMDGLDFSKMSGSGAMPDSDDEDQEPSEEAVKQLQEEESKIVDEVAAASM
jgi:hypothetical protein